MAATARASATSVIAPAEIWSMFRSELGRKSTIYFTALLLNAVLGVVVYGILTRAMDVQSFGTYSFIIAFFMFSGMFFDFGVAPAGMRLMALVDSAAAFSRRAGALLSLSAAVGLLFAVFVFAGSYAVDAWIHDGAGSVLRIVAPLAAVYPLQEMILSISQGSSRMKLMSAYLLMPRGILIVLLIALAATGTIDVRIAVTAMLLGMAAAIGIAIGVLKPVFRGLGSEIAVIWKEVREFGREVYLGRIVDGLMTGFDKLLLTKFHGMAVVGFYSIAMTMSTPIAMLSKAVSQSAYKSFATEDRIPRKLLMISLLWSTIGAAVFWMACQTLIPLFFTEKYISALSVLPWVMAGFALAGLNQPFHAFLAAHRRGRDIRIMSVTTSSINIVLNLSLIPLLAMTGAGIAFLTTYAVNIVMNLYFYRRYLGQRVDGTTGDSETHG